MEVEAHEKVYVAIGNELQDGLATLEWTLRKWSSDPISIVILHAPNYKNKDYVYSYYGKVPASYINDESLEFLRRVEKETMEKILNQYIAFCGKVKTDILSIEKYDEPIHKRIVELISGLRITKLVMGITFLNSSSWKSKSQRNGLWYLQREKPNFCELFLIWRGRLVYLREENSEGLIEDDLGVPLAKINKKSSRSIKGWFGKKMFPDNIGNSGKSPLCSPSSSSSSSNNSPDQWEKCADAIESYFNHILTSNEDREAAEVEDVMLNFSFVEPDTPAYLTHAERTEELKVQIGKAREEIQLKRREARESIERHTKAEWAINLCTSRASELEVRITEEIRKRGEFEKDLESTRGELQEVRSEIEQKRSKLRSVLELQRELSNKLKSSSLAKSRAEVQLEKIVRERAAMVQEIEKFRRQRDVMQRRIEFCREKDAIGMATTRLNDLNFNIREFSPQEIRVGTDDFSECLRLKSGGDFLNVYKGRINHTSVAVVLYGSSTNNISTEAFHANVAFLSRMKQPHLVAMLGCCPELKCIVFEYMHNGCLRDALFSNRSHAGRNKALNWHARIRIVAEVGSGLGFLHLTKPLPTSHGSLSPSKILLDHNNVAKIYGFRLDGCHDGSGINSDIRAFGNLILQILTGRNWGGLDEEAILMDHSALVEVLDQRAGKWPLELAVELARIAVKCISIHDELNTDLRMGTVMREIKEARQKAGNLLPEGPCSVLGEGGVYTEGCIVPPSTFFCPIYQEVMKNPHIAEDGFSYELEAIERWLETGHDTSPVTNLHLRHKILTPNHTLRVLIQDWHTKRSIPLPQ